MRPCLRVLVTLLAAGACWVAGAATGGPQTSFAARASGGRATAPTTRHLEYVAVDHAIYVYDIDHQNALVQTIQLAPVVFPRGLAMSPATGILYVAYAGSEGPTRGSIIAYDLRTRRTVWQRTYDTGIGSIAITPNGRTIYAPVGELSSRRTWQIVDARSGAVTGSIEAGAGPHNTVMSLDGRHVYLGGVGYPYLVVASVRTNRIVRRIGPLNSGGRPFSINGSQTLAFTTGHTLLGFQVSSIKTGKVLYTVNVPGFAYNPATFTHTPCHGLSLSPDEGQLYLIDTPNGYVHVFDVHTLPKSPPRLLANIKLAHPPPNDGWLQHSRDGHYVYVGRAGDVIDTRTRRIVAFLPPLQTTADSIEIDWRGGRPVATTSRYGLGYVTKR
jgi:DNA-binding beta-propeller fold protein YncE